MKKLSFISRDDFVIAWHMAPLYMYFFFFISSQKDINIASTNYIITLIKIQICTI